MPSARDGGHGHGRGAVQGAGRRAQLGLGAQRRRPLQVLERAASIGHRPARPCAVGALGAYRAVPELVRHRLQLTLAREGRLGKVIGPGVPSSPAASTRRSPRSTGSGACVARDQERQHVADARGFGHGVEPGDLEQVLRMGTRNTASILKLREKGVLEKGRMGDILLLGRAAWRSCTSTPRASPWCVTAAW